VTALEYSGFHTQTMLAQGLRTLFISLETRLHLDRPVAVYLAGGMAVHMYTGARVTTDIDAEFAGRLAIPQDLVIDVKHEDGSIRPLYFDVNYNPMFALMHEYYQEDSIALDIGTTNFKLNVLSPLDLAVSKLARFAANDREDIEALAGKGLISSMDLHKRATEALVAFVGGKSMVLLNIEDAVKTVRSLE